jgi:hypothetical protein
MSTNFVAQPLLMTASVLLNGRPIRARLDRSSMCSCLVASFVGVAGPSSGLLLGTVSVPCNNYKGGTRFACTLPFVLESFLHDLEVVLGQDWLQLFRSTSFSSESMTSAAQRMSRSLARSALSCGTSTDAVH